MIGFTNCLSTLFVPILGPMEYVYIAASIVIGIAFLFLLTKVPNKWRRPIIIGVTFVAGWFYFIEFIIPSSSEMASIRKETLVAERLVRQAANDVSVVETRVAAQEEARKNKKKTSITVSPAMCSQRTASADKDLSAALTHLDKIKSDLESAKPKADSRIESELKIADAFARDHHLTKDMVESDTYNGKSVIVNDKIKALMKRSNDITSANNSITLPFPKEGEKWEAGAITLINSAKSQLGNITQPGSNLTGILNKAADKIVEARTSVVSDNFLSRYKLPLATVNSVVGSFAFALGLFGLFSIHGKAIAKRKKGWYNSLAFFIAIATMTVLGFLDRYAAPHGSVYADFSHTAYRIVFEGGLTALQSTMFSLVAFYIVSAAYRAFRIRSVDAVIMMISAFLVMLSVVPVGMWMTSGLHGNLKFLKLENIGDWIMTLPNMAAQRGMQFGISVGGLAMALRIWLSLERGSYFDKQL
ncbi:MAG: hypothetical protein ABFD64_03375 [Armatimonadota bacterium]